MPIFKFIGMLAILVSLQSLLPHVQGATAVQQIFRNSEITVTFPPDGFAVQTQPKTPGKTYFERYVTHLKFCRQPKAPPHVQQVRSEDGWLCHFYVLPVLEKEKIKALVLQAHPQPGVVTYQKQPGIGEEKWNGHDLLVWREQYGKTRLDHFLVLGPKANYLFVSSPYGDGDRIREIVKTLVVQP